MMTYLKKLALSLVLACALAMPSLSQASPSNYTPQQQIDQVCDTLWLAALSVLVQQQIVGNCSSVNAGNLYTAMYLLTHWVFAQQLSLLTNGRLLAPSNGYRISENSSPQEGINAGEMFGNVSVWGNLSWNSLDDEFVNTPSESNSKVFSIGADTMLTDNFVIGLSLAYEDNDVETSFNGGDQDITSYTIAGYMGYLFNDNISFDAAIGHSDIDNDQTRVLSAFGAAVAPAGPFAGVAAGTPIAGDLDADRFFATINANGFWTVDNWLFNAHAGYLWAEEEHDAFTETGGGITAAVASRDFDLEQVRIGLEVGYDLQSKVEPFIGLDYVKDTESERVVLPTGMRQPDNDDDEFDLTLGTRFYASDILSGVFQFHKTFSRNHIDNHSLELLLHANF